MKKQLIAVLLIIIVSCNYQSNKQSTIKLWYDKPAENWVEALPVGNGRLGAMVYGSIEKEIIQFNEETLWTGQPHDYSHEGASQYLDTIRQLLWEGKQKEAHDLGNLKFMSQPFGQFCYQPFGDVILTFPGHEKAINYIRELDIETAISKVSYEIDGVIYERELFASNPDQAIFIKITTSEKGKLNFESSLSTLHTNSEILAEDNVVVLKGTSNNYPKELDFIGNPYPESKIKFEARLQLIENDGELATTESSLLIKNATQVTFVLVGATNFIDFQDISADPSKRCIDYLSGIEGKSFGSVKKAHMNDYQSLYNRLILDFGESEISNRPTDERLNTFYKDEDPNLVALLYQYGRYLLISSSRPGTQPANLQGIWNDQLSPPWDSKYTININAEMNYWPAEITNLSECAEPVIKMVEELAVTGKKIAKEHYNMDGWVAHHNTDIWRGAAPINNANHGLWVTGGAWLAQHLWWHFQFTGDKTYLKDRAYPVLKEASKFFSEYLVADPKNPDWLISGPSNSPENGGLVMGPTMDHQIIRNLFSNTIEAAEVLEIDEDFISGIKDKKSKIALNQIGQHGQLQEWLEDLDDPKNEHRHVSHLWGLHPGNEIHPTTTPELAEACKVTLSHRGDDGTGWSRAWKINFWARLLDGDHSFLLLKNLMVPAGNNPIDYNNKGGLYPNLFDAHPPFQIDGNFGATSGISEMLLQSHLKDYDGNYILDILPALPSNFANGKIEGICARGGFELDIEWKEGILQSLVILSKNGNSGTIRYKGKEIELATTAGKNHRYNGKLE
ncbi:MAG: glycoside hydrolase N-terminal domain-containing protein [Mariniphaga sp.]|nr:glycoside hydrolase N-terminal domain-containing protein [Mariniphaga sp.]